MKAVSNSTPLVHLSAMGRLELLHEMFVTLVIPDEVYDEVVVRGDGMPGAAEVSSAEWIERRTVSNRLALSILETNLGAGEAAAIVLSTELQPDYVILDDRSARLQARQLGLRVVGTVGILLDADSRGLLKFPESLAELLGTGFRLSPTERERVLTLHATRGAGGDNSTSG